MENQPGPTDQQQKPHREQPAGAPPQRSDPPQPAAAPAPDPATAAPPVTPPAAATSAPESRSDVAPPAPAAGRPAADATTTGAADVADTEAGAEWEAEADEGDWREYSMEFGDVPNLLERLGRTLLRGVLMLVYAVVFEIINYTVFGIAILQYLVIAATGRPIGPLQRVNEVLSAYMGDVTAYLTCVDDRAPFPVSRLRAARGLPLERAWRRPTNTAPAPAQDPHADR